MLEIAHAMGNKAQEAQGASQQWVGLLPLVLLGLIFYFLLIRPQQKRQKQHRMFLESLKKGDEVVTAGGLCGKISGITDNYVTLEISDKVRVKVLKSTIIDRMKGE